MKGTKLAFVFRLVCAGVVVLVSGSPLPSPPWSCRTRAPSSSLAACQRGANEGGRSGSKRRSGCKKRADFSRSACWIFASLGHCHCHPSMPTTPTTQTLTSAAPSRSEG
eukprot:6965694-Pyramimonas_sp.AAC.1